MRKAPKAKRDGMLDEYDFSKGERGKYAKRLGVPAPSFESTSPLLGGYRSESETSRRVSFFPVPTARLL